MPSKETFVPRSQLKAWQKLAKISTINFFFGCRSQKPRQTLVEYGISSPFVPRTCKPKLSGSPLQSAGDLASGHRRNPTPQAMCRQRQPRGLELDEVMCVTTQLLPRQNSSCASLATTNTTFWRPRRNKQAHAPTYWQGTKHQYVPQLAMSSFPSLPHSLTSHLQLLFCFGITFVFRKERVGKGQNKHLESSDAQRAWPINGLNKEVVLVKLRTNNRLFKGKAKAILKPGVFRRPVLHICIQTQWHPF